MCDIIDCTTTPHELVINRPPLPLLCHCHLIRGLQNTRECMKSEFKMKCKFRMILFLLLKCIFETMWILLFLLFSIRFAVIKFGWRVMLED